MRGWIGETLLADMQFEADRTFPRETGGVLMGFWAPLGKEVVVTSLIGPGPNAVHESDSFLPDAPYQEREIARVYRESGHIHTYLGDWHSHPRSTARLSRKDIGTLKRIRAWKDARIEIPIMGVLAGGEPWQLSVWALRRVRGAFNFRSARLEAVSIRVYPEPSGASPRDSDWLE